MKSFIKIICSLFSAFKSETIEDPTVYDPFEKQREELKEKGES